MAIRRSDTSILMARGLVPGHRPVNVVGFNRDIDSAPENISPDGVYATQTIPESIRVGPGGNAADSVSGSGARYIQIRGLDANFDYVEETIPLAGTSVSVLTTATFIRVLSAVITEVGTYGGTNAGNITLVTSGGLVIGTMEAGSGVTRFGAYTIPRGKTGYIESARFFTPGATQVVVSVQFRYNANLTAGPYSPSLKVLEADMAAPGGNIIIPETPAIVPEYTDISLIGVSEQGNNRPVSCIVTILLVDE